MMRAAVFYRLRAELRTQWRSWLGLGLLVGLVAGAALAFVSGARRTDSAYSRFLRASNAYDVLIINYPEDDTAVFDFDEISRLPQVLDSARADAEYYTLDALNLISQDGRIGTEINRSKILDGRRANPDKPEEVVVAFTLAEKHGLQVGDTLDPVPPEIIELVQSGATQDPEGDLAPEEIAYVRRLLEQLPGGKLRIVGTEAAPGEFPPQFTANRPLVHLTPAAARLFSPDGEHQALLVRLRGGDAAVDGFVDELERRSGGRGLDVLVQRDHAAAVDRSIHFQAVALWLLAALTAAAGALILGQLLARLAYLESNEHPTLHALGMTAGDRTALGILRAAVIGVVGAAVGVGGAVGVSPLFPTGLARTAEPSPGIDADASVLLLGGVLTVVVVVAVSLWPAWRAARARASSVGWDVGARRPRLALGGGLPAPAAIGVRMAVDAGRGGRSVPVRTTLVGVTLGVVALVAALTFGASLSHLLDTPRLYGVTWDLELVNYEGSDFTVRAVEILRDDDRVAAVAVGSASFAEAIEVEGHRVGAIVFGSVKGGLSPPLLTGRAPVAADEIVLGPRTLRSLDVDVGDVVEVRQPGVRSKTLPFRVVGTAVFPTVSEHAQLGRGALVTPDAAAALEPADAEIPFGFTLELASGVDRQAVVADLNEQLGEEVFPIEGGKPTDIVNFGRVQAMPFVLGGILATIAAAALVHLLLSAVRRRRRELAILKTLGFVRAQVAATVACQATAVVVIGLLFGVPSGIALGRWVWLLMADSLGVVPRHQVPVVILAVTVVAAVLVANLIALFPGQLAARTRPAVILRSE